MKKFTSINVEINRSKESEDGRIKFQNKCVSSQKGRIEKRRGRYRSGVTYLPSAGSFVRRAVGQ
jgi:hypothetical protein